MLSVPRQVPKGLLVQCMLEGNGYGKAVPVQKRSLQVGALRGFLGFDRPAQNNPLPFVRGQVGSAWREELPQNAVSGWGPGSGNASDTLAMTSLQRIPCLSFSVEIDNRWY